MLKCFTLIVSIFLFSQSLFAQMVLKYKTTVLNTVISIPLNGTVNVTVDWGDGSSKETFTSAGVQTHKYVLNGSYIVKISGSLSHFGSENPKKPVIIGPSLISVENWEGLGLNSLSFAFYEASRLISVPTSLPTSVTDLDWMFTGDSSFNQNINTWNTDNITNMGGMFYGAVSFSQPIGSWNTQRVTNMVAMFADAISFNQPLSTWNTVKVEDMSSMFYNAHAFNQPIGTWNTASVTDMSWMFFGASVFNQPIGTWNITNVKDMSGMLEGVALCTVHYDQLLNGWAAQDVKLGVHLFAGGNHYSAAATAARSILLSKSWSIVDKGLGVDNTKCPSITGVANLEGSTDSQKIEIYPNPSAGLFTVSGLNSLGSISIYNSVGILVYETKTNETSQIIDLTSYEAGIYLLKAGSKSTKLVIE